MTTMHASAIGGAVRDHRSTRADRSRTTIHEYELVLTKVVIPEPGGLRLREVTPVNLTYFFWPTTPYGCSRRPRTALAQRTAS